MSEKRDIKLILEKISRAVESAALKMLFRSSDKKFEEIIKYQFSSGGKRLRPILAILSSNLMGGKLKDCLYPAASLEILHNYTLIIDDLIDRSELRRGSPTLWKKFGKGIADSVSLYYAASIFDIPRELKNKEKIYKVLARTLKEVTDGEIYDILFEQSGRQDESYVVRNRYKKLNINDYYKMTGLKTASLLRSCMEVGGISADASERDLKFLRDFGFNLGIAFQIRDDILDIFGEEKKFGKQIGKDIMERKLGNIVILLAMEEFAPADKIKFLRLLRQDNIKDSDAKIGIALIKKTKAQERAHKLEVNFINKAKRSLANLPQNKWNKILEELVDFLVTRKV